MVAFVEYQACPVPVVKLALEPPIANLFQISRNSTPALTFDFDGEEVGGVAGSPVQDDVGAFVVIAGFYQVEINIQPGQVVGQILAVVCCQVGFTLQRL